MAPYSSAQVEAEHHALPYPRLVREGGQSLDAAVRGQPFSITKVMVSKVETDGFFPVLAAKFSMLRLASIHACWGCYLPSTP